MEEDVSDASSSFSLIVYARMEREKSNFLFGTDNILKNFSRYESAH